MRTRRTLALLALAGTMGCRGDGVRVDRERLASDEARARGAELFQSHCALCHGEDADGRGRRRRGLVGQPANLRDPAWQASVDAADVYRTIRDGRPGTSMPAWRAFDEDQLWDLVAYVRSLTPRS